MHTDESLPLAVLAKGPFSFHAGLIDLATDTYRRAIELQPNFPDVSIQYENASHLPRSVYTVINDDVSTHRRIAIWPMPSKKRVK